MTPEIGLLLTALAAMVVLFLTEKLPVDLTAFLGLCFLIFAGYVDSDEAFTGFASSAVITMLAIFIVSAALLQTGVADYAGGMIHRLVGGREIPLVVTVMMVAGVLSAFMNNIAAAAVLMPAVASLGRQAGIAPSRLFMPLSFGAILGGTTTLVGTPPNILVGAIMEERGLEPFQLFDFAPAGFALLAAGVLFMATVGRRLLPSGEAAEGRGGELDLARLYGLEDRLFSIRIPKDSALDGATLGATRLGSALRVQILGVQRGRKRVLAPDVDTVLAADDVLMVQGSMEDLRELLRVRDLEVRDGVTGEFRRPAQGFGAVVAKLRESSPLVGKTLAQASFRERYGVTLVELVREGETIRERLAAERLRAGDEIVGVGPEPSIARLVEDFLLLERGDEALSRLTANSVFVLDVPADSALVDSRLAESRMGELMGLSVIAVFHGDEGWVPVTPDLRIDARDRLLVAGEQSRIKGLLAVGDLQLERGVSLGSLESDDVAVIEAAVAPRSSADGRTLRSLRFREAHGLQVMAIWRGGEVLRDDLGDVELRVGDALLLQGPREKLARFAASSDFVVLSRAAEREVRKEKALWALGGLVLMVGLVIAGIQPIQVAAFAAATLVVLSGALTMQEAYRAIEWKAIFLVAAMLPVGQAMESSGAAALLAGSVTEGAGQFGPYAVLAAMVALSSLLSQGLDGAPAVVLMAPVVMEAAETLAISPHPLMMGVGMAASAAFMTPFSHKANLLVMGLGGYRTMDFVRVGTPLTFVVLALIVAIVPLIFPF